MPATTKTEQQILKAMFTDTDWQLNAYGNGCTYQLPNGGKMTAGVGRYIRIMGVVAKRIAKRMVEQGKLTEYKTYLNAENNWEYYVAWPHPVVMWDATTGDRFIMNGAIATVTDTTPDYVLYTVPGKDDKYRATYSQLNTFGAVYAHPVGTVAAA